MAHVLSKEEEVQFLADPDGVRRDIVHRTVEALRKPCLVSDLTPTTSLVAPLLANGPAHALLQQWVPDIVRGVVG